MRLSGSTATANSSAWIRAPATRSPWRSAWIAPSTWKRPCSNRRNWPPLFPTNGITTNCGAGWKASTTRTSAVIKCKPYDVSRLQDLNIRLMVEGPAVSIYARGDCIAAVGGPHGGGAGINQGSTGMMTDQGLAYLVWRDGRPRSEERRG